MLRPPGPQDVAALVRACGDADIANFTRVPVPYAEGDALDFLRGAADTWAAGTSVVFVIAGSADELLGTCGLMLGATHGELGYLVAPWARRRGVATEAMSILTAWAHKERGLPRVVAKIEDVNLASIAAARAAGYRQFGDGFELELKGTSRKMHYYEHCA